MNVKAIINAAMLMVCSMASAQTREAAVLFSGTDLDESYLLKEKVSVVFDEDGKALISLDGMDEMEFVIVEGHPVTAVFKDAFKLKANQDPDHPDNYYATFYTSEGAYKVKEPETAKAYSGKVDGDVLKMTAISNDIILKKQPVVLKASVSDITLMPSDNMTSAFSDRQFKGTDEATTLGENDYALSLGQKGVGFYLWNGKEIGANKAYLTISGTSNTNEFVFQFDDEGITGIDSNYEFLNADSDEVMYNLNGMRVDDSYKGIVIKNGKKIFNK